MAQNIDFPGLPDGVGSRFIDGVNGLRVHVLEAGRGPLVLLLHGFPELAYSWRKILVCRWPRPDSTLSRRTSVVAAAPPAVTPPMSDPFVPRRWLGMRTA